MTPKSMARALVLAFCLNSTLLISASYAKTGKSGLPLPRYVSLRSDNVNLRQGPGKDFAIGWVFKRLNLPVEIIAEYDHWRKVRDSQGTEGWVFHRLLTGRRTALVMPWEKKIKVLKLYRTQSDQSQITAKIETGVLATVNECNGKWCHVDVSNISGWIAQKKLWGVYADEQIKK